MSDKQKSEALAEFSKWFEEFSTYIMKFYPDPMDEEGETFAELLNAAIRRLAMAEKAMNVFIRWIKARKDAYSSAKSFLDTIYRIKREESSLSSRITLFLIPIFNEMLKALNADMKYTSKVKPFLPTISKISKGSGAVGQRLDGLKVLGVNPRGFASHVEKYFEAVANGRLDEAKAIFESIKTNFENLKQTLKKSAGQKEKSLAR